MSPFEYLQQIPAKVISKPTHVLERKESKELVEDVVIYGRTRFFYNKTKAMVSCKRFVRAKVATKLHYE